MATLICRGMKTKFYIALIWALAGISLQGIGYAQTAKPSRIVGLFKDAASFDAFQHSGADTNQLGGMRLSVRSKTVVIHNGNARISVPKDSIWGYCRRNQKCYRWDVARGRAFEILEHKAIVVYKAFEPRYTSKGYVPTPVIYFSKELDAEITPLTASQLKLAFPSAIALHHFLDSLSDPATICAVDEATQSFYIQQWIQQYVPKN